MDSALAVHRLHFAFTITYHYLFPQLTMGLAPLVVWLRARALRTPGVGFEDASRLLARIFAVSFVFGVVTGIPMEFQFGTNWARFSQFAGGVIGQTLAMEGMFAFFLESTFLGLFLFGEKRLSPRAHVASGVALWLGAWLSGYFIVATDAWMQHPVGYTRLPDGRASLANAGALLWNEWAFWQYLHTMCGAVVTGAFVTAGLGAYYVLRAHVSGVSVPRTHVAQRLLGTGVVVAFAACVVQIFPTGDRQGQLVARHQPAALAAMEGLFERTTPGAPIVLVGQPNVHERRIDNALEVPGVLSFLTYRRWDAEVQGLDAFPPDERPDNVALVYYSYHVMVGLGTLFLAAAGLSALAWWRGRLARSPALLWVLILATPLPFVANTAGWMTAEIGRQPWLVYGLFRTADGPSPRVSAGNGLFTLIGFAGLYSLLSVAFVLLIAKIVQRGSGAPVPPLPPHASVLSAPAEPA